jgi:putative ABC transport system ATP-binding protein
MQNNVPAILLTEIEFCWGSAKNDFSIQVRNFRLEKNESVILVGPSGGGKSTLLSLICGTAKPQKGIIEIIGKNLGKMSKSVKDNFRADNIGIIFQQFNLLPYLSAIDNVLLPLEFSQSRKQAAGGTKAQYNSEAKRLLQTLNITPETLGTQKAATLSIGQQQRVAAARAFIGSPELIIADEPTSSLDEESQDKFLNQLFFQKDETGASLLMVSHNPRIAKRFDRVINIDDICTISPKKVGAV